MAHEKNAKAREPCAMEIVFELRPEGCDSLSGEYSGESQQKLQMFAFFRRITYDLIITVGAE